MVVAFWFCCFKQKTAYEMRISDWSSDVCSSDLLCAGEHRSQRKHALVRSDRYCRGVSRPRWVLLKPDGLPTKADDGRRTSGSKYPCGAPQGSSVHVEGFAVVIVHTRLSTLTMISDAEGS